MDTRSKIIGIEEAARHTGHTAVLSTFDVLTAPRIRRLREIADRGRPLLAIVTEQPGSLLPLRARAELAASLAIIDVVVIVQEFVPGLFPNVLDEREPDERRTLDLIELIQRRNRTAAGA